MRVLGRFGDTHMTPGVLFEPSDRMASPTRDSIDVQFRVPVSLSLLLEEMTAADRRAEVESWAVGYHGLLVGMVRAVQAAGGYVIESSDTAAPARLDIAVTIDEVVPGVGTRWHSHVWVGPTALTLAVRERRPVAVEVLTEGVQELVWPVYIRRLEELTRRELGVRWGEPRPGAVREIVEPPWHEHVGNADRGICPGRWEIPRNPMLADARELTLAAEAEVRHDHAVRGGGAYEPDVDLDAARAGLMRGLMSAGPIRGHDARAAEG